MNGTPSTGPGLKVVVGVHPNDEDPAILTSEQLTEVLASRAVIEQAKGMLMLVYGIDADDAFDILRRQSQEHNIKVRLIAGQISADLVELSKCKSAASEVSVDGLMRAARQRVAATAARYRNGRSEADKQPPASAGQSAECTTRAL